MLEHMGNDFLPSCSFEKLDESVGERSIYYRLGDSELFTFANKNTTVGKEKLIDVIPRMVVEDHGFLRVDFSQLDKSTKFELFDSGRFKMSCKKSLQSMVERGDVIMVYSEEYMIPTSIPFIVQTNGRNSRIFVNISDFVELNQYGQYVVTQTRNYNALMAVLFAAALAQKIVSTTSALPADLADGLVLSYASMLETVINSLVHLDPVGKEKIRYLATEFALIQMYGTEKGTTLFYRMKQTYFAKLSKLIMDSIDNQFKLDNFDKLSLFIDQLKELYPSMHGLSVYTVYDRWIRRYGAATAMSIDYLGYHLYTICMVLMESPLITRMALEPIMEKNKGADMYKRMQAMIGTN